MWSKILNVLLVAIIILFVYNKFIKSPDVAHGEKAPAVEATLVNGKSFSITDLEGKYVLVDFWASWCGPCIKDSPKVVSLYNKYHGESFSDADDFEVVSIALEKKEDRWQKMAERFGFAWENQIVDVVKFVRLSAFANAYDVTEIPTKFLINPKGEIIGVDQPAAEIDKFLAGRLN